MTMKSIAGQLVVVLLLLAAGVVWSAGQRESRLAEAQGALLAFRYGEAAAQLEDVNDAGVITRRLPGVSTGIVERVRAAADYWGAGYRARGPESAPLFAANAAYRAATREGGDWRAAVGRLDDVIKQYAELLRNRPGNVDASYNYEFAVRYRAAIAARQQPVPAADPSLETTLHGRVGAPPRGTDMRSFKMIVPMRPDERRAAEEAGRGPRRLRKG